MIKKVTLNEIRQVANINVQCISENDRDEMAIPSYLHTNPLIRWLMWRRYEIIADLISDSNRDTVLEFGCGLGLFLPELKSTFEQVYAIDLFPDYAMELARRKGLDIRFTDNLGMITDQSLDVIVAADVLEHIENLEEYLQQFHRLLRPEGLLIVSGPTENIFYRAGRYAAGFWNKGDYHHTNIDCLIKDIGSFGFTQQEVQTLPFDYLPSLFKIGRFRNFQ